MNREARANALKVSVDVIIFAASFPAAVFIAFQGIPDPAVLGGLLLLAAGAVVFRTLGFLLFSVFPLAWKSMTPGEALRIAAAVLPATVLLALGRIIFPETRPLWQFPWSLIFLDLLFVLAGTLGIRLADRLAHERSGRRKRRKRLLLIGTGDRAVRFIRDLKRAIDPDFEVAGLVADGPERPFRWIEGVLVVGTVAQIPAIVRRLRFDEAVLTIEDLAPEDLRRIIENFRGTGTMLTRLRDSFEPLYDETGFAAVPAAEGDAAVREQLAAFKELTGRDYDPHAETAYPVDHPFEMNKPFSDPEGLTGDYLAAAGTMIKLLGLPAGSSVLDLGCGCGWTTIFLARCGFKATGVDLNEASLAVGRKNAEKAGLSVNFVRADCQTVAFDRFFDGVVIFDSLHHCLREADVLARALTALRPKGKILLSEQYHPDDDRAAVLTHAAAVEAMRKFGTLEKGLGKRYLIRRLYACGFERAVLLSTPGLHGIWIAARKPRKTAEAARGLLFAEDYDRALWPFD